VNYIEEAHAFTVYSICLGLVACTYASFIAITTQTTCKIICNSDTVK